MSLDRMAGSAMRMWGLALLLFLFALVFIWIGSTRREAVRVSVARLTREAAERNHFRMVLWGKSAPGNAWDQYSKAIKDAEDLYGSVEMLNKFADRDASVDRRKVEELLARYPDLLERLQSGALQADGQYLYEWNQGAGMRIPGLLGSRMLGLLAVAQARILSEGGRTQEASDLLLDTCVFAGDLGSNGVLLSHLIGLAVYNTALNEARYLLISGKLTRAELSAFEKKLEMLDRDFPRVGPVFANEALEVGSSILQSWNTPLSIRGLMDEARMMGWKSLITPGGSMAAGYHEMETCMRQCVDIDKMQYADAQKEARLIDAQLDKSGLGAPSVSKSLITHNGVLSQLRLLRAGAALLSDGGSPAMQDPFSNNPLQMSRAGKLKIWSVGSNEKDDGGKGSWNTASEDILLEIPQ